MDQDKFKAIYAESRNGANSWIRHPVARRFIYSDGVQELAEVGIYWLLDIIGTEGVDAMVKHPDSYLCQVDVIVKTDGTAEIEMKPSDDEPPILRREIDWTDMPEGKWTFFLADDEGTRAEVKLFLVSEY